MATQESGVVQAKSDEIAGIWEVFVNACSPHGLTPSTFDEGSIRAQKLVLTVTAMLEEVDSIGTKYPALAALVSETRQKLCHIRAQLSPPAVPAVPRRFEPTEEAKQFIRDHAERFAPLCEGSVTDVYSERCTRIHVVQGTFARCVAFQAYKTNTEAKESLLAWIGQVVNSESTEKRWSDEIRTWLRGGLRAEVLEAAVALMYSCKLRTLRAAVARMQSPGHVPSATEVRGAWVQLADVQNFVALLVALPHTDKVSALSWGAHVLATCTHPVVSTMWRVYSGAPEQNAFFSATLFRTHTNVLTWLHVRSGLREAGDVSWLFATADESTSGSKLLSLQHASLTDKEGAEDVKSIFDNDDVLDHVNLLSQFQLFCSAPPAEEG